MKQQILELLQEELTFNELISKLDNKNNVGLDIFKVRVLGYLTLLKKERRLEFNVKSKRFKST